MSMLELIRKFYGLIQQNLFYHFHFFQGNDVCEKLSNGKM